MEAIAKMYQDNPGHKVWCLQMEIIQCFNLHFLKYVAILCLSTTICVGPFWVQSSQSQCAVYAELYYSTIDDFSSTEYFFDLKQNLF